MAERSMRRTRIDSLPDLADDYIVDKWYVPYEFENPHTFMRSDGAIPEPMYSELPVYPSQVSINTDASGEVESPIFAVGAVAINFKGQIIVNLGGFGCYNFYLEFPSTSQDRDPPTSLVIELFGAKVILSKIDASLYSDLLLRGDNQRAMEILDQLRYLEPEDVISPRSSLKNRVEMIQIMREIKRLMFDKYLQYGEQRRLQLRWVRGEENFTADHFSHMGRALGVPTELMPYHGTDWTFQYLYEKGSPGGVGFCYFEPLCKTCMQYGHPPAQCPKKQQKNQKEKLPVADTFQNQNVIIPEHLLVTELDRCQLTFGTFDSADSFVSQQHAGIGISKTKDVKKPPAAAHNKPSGSGRAHQTVTHGKEVVSGLRSSGATATKSLVGKGTSIVRHNRVNESKLKETESPSTSSNTQRESNASGKRDPVVGAIKRETGGRSSSFRKAPKTEWRPISFQKSSVANPGKTSTFVAHSPQNSAGLTKEAVDLQ